MLKILHILSQTAKFIFYGLMAYFMVLVFGILSGSYRFSENNTAFTYMVATSGVAAVSLLLADLHGFLVKRKAKSESASMEVEPAERNDSDQG